jgi:hypothetical protein
LLKEELGWYEGKRDWFELLQIYADLGYLGIENDFVIDKLHQPIKRKRKTKNNLNPKLTEEQKAYNKKVSSTRILVEHAIGSMKFFNVLTQPYRNRRFGFEDLSVEICAGLHNLYISTKSC